MLFLRRLKTFLKDIYFTSDTRPAVLACIISAYIWGSVLILPAQVLQRPFYVGLAQISGNEYLWGSVFLILGTVQLIRLIPKKSVPRFIWIEYLLRLCSCILWTYITFTAALNFPTPPVVGDTCCIMLAAWWDFLRYNGHSSELQYMRWSHSEE